MNRKSFWFLVLLSLAGALIAGVVISRYGPGVSSDATKYLSISANLLAGRGFFDHTGMPLLWWPPLYPLVLAGVSRLTGMDILFAGGVLNLVLFALNIFLHGAIVFYAFREKPLYGVLGGLFILISDMSIRIHTNISSEPLFVSFSLIFLIAGAEYIETRSPRSFWWMTAMSALAPLQRYLGVSLIAAGGCFILYAYRDRVWRGIRESFLFGVLSTLPIAAWIGFHNLGQYNSFWGVTGSIVLPMENLRLSISKILHWFVPYHPLLGPIFDNPWIPIAVVALGIVLLNKKENWIRAGRLLTQPYPLMSWLFFVLTILGLMFTVTTEDHVDLFSDRYYAGLLSPVLVLMFVLFDALLLPHWKIKDAVVQKVIVVAFAAWFVIYPGWSMLKYVVESRRRGEPSGYNVYNNRAFHTNPMIQLMRDIAQDDPDAALYSNYTDGVWFFTRRESPLMPRSFTMDMDEISQTYAGWPGDKPGYIFWILPNSIYRSVVPPKLLAKIANLELVYKLEEGEVYTVSAPGMSP